MLSSTIQTRYGTQAYSAATRVREAKRTGTRAGSFLELAAQAGGSRMDTLTTGMSGIMGMTALPTSLMMDLSALSAGQLQAEGAEAAEAPSLEEMLKAKYPNIHYHVFDASSSL